MSVPIPEPTQPPYNLSSLHPPLTMTQRSRLIAWAERNGLTLPVTISDSDLLARCIDLQQGNISGTPSLGSRIGQIGEGATTGTEAAIAPVMDLAHFLGKLTDPHLWVRVGEITLGVILVAVSINAALKQGLNSNSTPSAPPPHPTSLGGLGSAAKSVSVP